jgi:hypothetical protein
LTKAFPEIPPVLPFSKGGELFPPGFLEDEILFLLKERNDGWLPAFQRAKMLSSMDFIFWSFGFVSDFEIRHSNLSAHFPKTITQ